MKTYWSEALQKRVTVPGYAVVRVYTPDGDRVAIDEEAGGTMTQDEAQARCSELAETLGLPIYDQSTDAETVEVLYLD